MWEERLFFDRILEYATVWGEALFLSFSFVFNNAGFIYFLCTHIHVQTSRHCLDIFFLHLQCLFYFALVVIVVFK